MTEVAPQLDYAPPPKLSRAVRARRVAIVVGMLLLLAGGVWVTPRAVRRMQVVYWQSQCMQYTAPADQIVHTTDPAEFLRLLAQGYAGSLPNGHTFLVPAAYRDYAGSMVASQSFGTVFLHRRKTPKGEERLVAVDLRMAGITQNKITSFAGNVAEPVGVLGSRRGWGSTTGGRDAVVSLRPGDRYTVYAGQPDPSDESHFTIDYVLNGTRYTLDGWLRDDGSVHIE